MISSGPRDNQHPQRAQGPADATMQPLTQQMEQELARARRIVARSDLSPQWVEGATALVQEWADAEATECGWPPAAVTVPSTAALPEVLAAVARARLATARDAGEAGTRMGTGLAELRRAHGG